MGLEEVQIRNLEHRANRAGWLRAAVLGSNDGLVSTASLMIAIAAANKSDFIITAGLAGIAAGAMSMAVGEYVSVKSQLDVEKTVDHYLPNCYNTRMFSKKESQVSTATYQALTEQQKREVRMYGVTEAGMRESVESSITFRFSGPAMMAASLMSDAQEMINTEYGEVDSMRAEDARQCLNRAKWILFEYVMKDGE